MPEDEEESSFWDFFKYWILYNGLIAGMLWMLYDLMRQRPEVFAQLPDYMFGLVNIGLAFFMLASGFTLVGALYIEAHRRLEGDQDGS